jgi:hypothetical protein
MQKPHAVKTMMIAIVVSAVSLNCVIIVTDFMGILSLMRVVGEKHISNELANVN